MRNLGQDITTEVTLGTGTGFTGTVKRMVSVGKDGVLPTLNMYKPFTCLAYFMLNFSTNWEIKINSFYGTLLIHLLRWFLHQSKAIQSLIFRFHLTFCLKSEG